MDIENADLDVIGENNNLQDEIMLLKVVIRRVWELASEEANDLETWSRSLNTLGMAISRQAGLARVQSMMSGGNTDVVQALSQAIKEVTDEIHESKKPGP